MAYTLALSASAPALTRPQRAVLKVEGERIVDIEYRPEGGAASPFARAERLSPDGLAAAAAGCPRCGCAHALALCQALETLAGVVPPRRAALLRLTAAELERAASHLEAAGAIFAALALSTTAAAFSDEGQAARAALKELTGEQRPWIVPGGVAHDLGVNGRETVADYAAVALDRLFALADTTVTRRPLLARTVEVGVISASAAAQFHLAGPMARAAGLTADLRLDAPYGAYEIWRPDLVTQEGGDVYARLMVLVLESLESLKLVGRAIADLPAGPTRAELPSTLPAGSAEGLAEAPRGPVRYTVEADGRSISAVSCTPAPQLDRLLARTAMAGAVLDDAALILVSGDPCDVCLGMAHP